MVAFRGIKTYDCIGQFLEGFGMKFSKLRYTIIIIKSLSNIHFLFYLVISCATKKAQTWRQSMISWLWQLTRRNLMSFLYRQVDLFGSDRSSRNANVRPSVRVCQTCLEQTIFICLAQRALREQSSSQGALRKN